MDIVQDSSSHPTECFVVLLWVTMTQHLPPAFYLDELLAKQCFLAYEKSGNVETVMKLLENDRKVQSHISQLQSLPPSPLTVKDISSKQLEVLKSILCPQSKSNELAMAWKTRGNTFHQARRFKDAIFCYNQVCSNS
jgi:hypothetical protein